MNSIFTGDLIARFLSLDRFQSDFRLQLCAVSLAYSWHPFPPFFASLDTAILAYRPVQDLGTIISKGYSTGLNDNSQSFIRNRQFFVQNQDACHTCTV